MKQLNDNDKKMFSSGYCLEYAIALKEDYEQKNISVQLALVQKEIEFDDFLEESILETAHAFLLIELNEIKYGHDAHGIRKIDEIIENCLFLSAPKENKAFFEIVNSVEDAESYLGFVSDEAIEIAKEKISLMDEFKSFQKKNGLNI